MNSAMRFGRSEWATQSEKNKPDKMLQYAITFMNSINNTVFPQTVTNLDLIRWFLYPTGATWYHTTAHP